jgi:hypothetical protein
MKTTKRSREGRDNKTGSDEYTKFVIRLIRSFMKKATMDEVDITALEQLAQIQKELDERTAEVVGQLQANGYTWQQIGDALGMHRSAAYNKFKGRVAAEHPSRVVNRMVSSHTDELGNVYVHFEEVEE